MLKVQIKRYSTFLRLLFFTLPFLFGTSCDRSSIKDVFSADNKTSASAKITRTDTFNIFEFDPQSMKMGVALRKPRKADFYLNSNFFSEKPIGLVVIKGKRSHARVKGGGYFYVVDGVPKIQAKTCPKLTEYASQTILWGIDDGVLNASLFKEKHAKEKAFRSIIGTKNDGRFLLVASNEKSTVTIEEISKYALNLGMLEGILFDGGSSLDYKISTVSDIEVCQPVSSLLKKIAKKHEPMVYLYGNFK
jgi:hypothetical protein